MKALHGTVNAPIMNAQFLSKFCYPKESRMPTRTQYDTLAVATDARGVSRVTLARPAVMNAFDEAMIAEMTEMFEVLGADPATRVVVLAAEGKAFCAGADLRWMERAAANSRQENLADAHRFANMMHVLATCPKPVIARVQGAAFGGGLGLCCACDIVVASPRATFAVSEARFGILPAVIGPYLANAVGKRQALRLALTAATFDADFAQEIGLVHTVAQEDRLDAAIEEFISDLLGNGPHALGEIKRLFGWLEMGEIDETVRELTAQTIARVRSTPEAREGIAAFLGKRPAPWVRSS
jgi:methylglutaconyl-CoA hydratase